MKIQKSVRVQLADSLKLVDGARNRLIQSEHGIMPIILNGLLQDSDSAFPHFNHLNLRNTRFAKYFQRQRRR